MQSKDSAGSNRACREGNEYGSPNRAAESGTVCTGILTTSKTNEWRVMNKCVIGAYRKTRTEWINIAFNKAHFAVRTRLHRGLAADALARQTQNGAFRDRADRVTAIRNEVDCTATQSKDWNQIAHVNITSFAS